MRHLTVRVSARAWACVESVLQSAGIPSNLLPQALFWEEYMLMSPPSVGSSPTKKTLRAAGGAPGAPEEYMTEQEQLMAFRRLLGQATRVWLEQKQLGAPVVNTNMWGG